NEKQRQAEIDAGRERQDQLRSTLLAWGQEASTHHFKNRDAFVDALKAAASKRDVRLSAAEVKFIVAALGERDPSAEACTGRHGAPEPDSQLRDTESVPLKEATQTYFEREVLPHVPDAWVDDGKTKVGYGIPLNRQFYVYEPPRPLEAIEAEIKDLEKDIVRMLAKVTGTKPEEVIQ
ncbi:MAG: SAM-dependent DNA methyltransferase, partial [Planctomycetes bacterium]|nr:SAM-dependent DNA methyltransferase [Planctomycetota bacterium]